MPILASSAAPLPPTEASTPPSASSSSSQFLRPKSPFRKLVGLATSSSPSSSPSPAHAPALPPLPKASPKPSPSSSAGQQQPEPPIEAAHEFHPSQIELIRGALGKEEQLIRVSDATTGEVYDLHIRRSDPYAVPIGQKASLQQQQQQKEVEQQAPPVESDKAAAADDSYTSHTSNSSTSRAPRPLKLPQLVSKRASAGQQQLEQSLGIFASPPNAAEASAATSGNVSPPVASRGFGYRNSVGYFPSSIIDDDKPSTKPSTTSTPNTTAPSAPAMSSGAAVVAAAQVVGAAGGTAILPPSPPTSDEVLPGVEDDDDDVEAAVRVGTSLGKAASESTSASSKAQPSHQATRYTTADYFGSQGTAGPAGISRGEGSSGRSGGTHYDTASEDEGRGAADGNGKAGWISSFIGGLPGTSSQTVYLTAEPDSSLTTSTSTLSNSNTSPHKLTTLASSSTSVAGSGSLQAQIPQHLLVQGAGAGTSPANSSTSVSSGAAVPGKRGKTTSGGSATLSAVPAALATASTSASGANAQTSSLTHPRRPPSAGSLGTTRSGSRRSSRERPAVDVVAWNQAPAQQPQQQAQQGQQQQQLPSSHVPAYPTPSVRTGDAAFDEEASKNAERLLRQRRAKQQQQQEGAAVVAVGGRDGSAEYYHHDGVVGEVAPVEAVDRPGLLTRRGTRPPTRERSLTAAGFSQLIRDATSGSGSGDGGHTAAAVLGSPTTANAPGGGALASPISPTAATGPHAKDRDAEEDGPKVLVGNLIGEDHVNYVLMYNMLTGIRIGVSRCQAKIKRPLTDDDYKAKHKFTFDIIGNELTPSAKYDFKFKDYAPWVFRELREYFHLDPADYLLSLTAKYILSELGSPGKSGSFFYFSRDYRFIIKTIRHSEHKFLLSILKDYHEHVKANPHTLLSRFYGLHRVKLPRGRKIHFVIMNNLFPPHRDIHETYDLKGSIIGREYDEVKARQKKGAVMKDINWLRRDRKIELGPEKRALFEAQLQSDVALLKRLNIMDYSLLIGLHDMRRGNREGLRQEKLQVFHPDTASNAAALKREPSSKNKRLVENNASFIRAAVRREGPKSLTSGSQLPTKDSSERRHFFFYQDEGGFRSTNENNEPTDMIYYLGVIDLFTPYTSIKRGETWWKGMTQDRHMISSVPPKEYGDRFLKFMTMCTNKAATWPGWKDKAKALPPNFDLNGDVPVIHEKEQSDLDNAAAADGTAQEKQA